MRIHYFTPFSAEKNFLQEIDYYFGLLPTGNDWACILDGDTLFLRPDFGNCILEYVARYPETGLFTSYASRCHYQFQVPQLGDVNNPSIAFHKGIADILHGRHQPSLDVKQVNRRVAGHLMLIKKSTWTEIRAAVFERCKLQQKKILGVDTQISYAVLAAGKDIKLMRGIYLLHYLRYVEGFNSDKHLK